MANADAIQRALEAAGVVFVEENGHGPGVRLRKAAGQSIPTIEDEADPTSRDQ